MVNLESLMNMGRLSMSIPHMTLSDSYGLTITATYRKIRNTENHGITMI